MKFSDIKKVGVIGIAAIGSVLVVTILLTITLLITIQSKSITSILPTASTYLLFENPSEQFVMQTKKWIPALKDIPAVNGIDAIALLKIQENFEPIFIVKTSKEQPEILRRLQSVDIAPYRIYSKNTIDPAMFESETSIEDDSGFIALNYVQEDTGWVVFRSEVLPDADTEQEQIVQKILFGNSPLIGAHFTETTLTIHRVQANQKTVPALSDSSLSYIRNPLFTLYTSNALQNISTFTSTLDSSKTILLDTLIETKVYELLGKDISIQFDLARLLQEESKIEYSTTASGNTLFAVSGTFSNKKDVERLLQKLHNSAGNSAISAVISERTLDNFQSRNIRYTEKKNSIIEEVSNDWEITTSQNASGQPTLTTATKLKRFVITNATKPKVMLQNAVTISYPKTSSILSARLIAGGTVDQSFMSTITKKIFSDSGAEDASLLVLDGADIHWALYQQGVLQTLILEKSQ